MSIITRGANFLTFIEARVIGLSICARAARRLAFEIGGDAVGLRAACAQVLIVLRATILRVSRISCHSTRAYTLIFTARPVGEQLEAWIAFRACVLTVLLAGDTGLGRATRAHALILLTSYVCQMCVANCAIQMITLIAAFALGMVVCHT